MQLPNFPIAYSTFNLWLARTFLVPLVHVNGHNCTVNVNGHNCTNSRLSAITPHVTLKLLCCSYWHTFNCSITHIQWIAPSHHQFSNRTRKICYHHSLLWSLDSIFTTRRQKKYWCCEHEPFSSLRVLHARAMVGVIRVQPDNGLPISTYIINIQLCLRSMISILFGLTALQDLKYDASRL